jgi:hypothetical protein
MMQFAFWRHKKQLAEACAAIRDELDDHRSAINDNGRDIAETRELIGILDEKIEKVNSRIDELFLLMGAEQSLTPRELALQQFLQTARTLDEVAAFWNDSVAATEHALRCLYFKGVHVYQVVENGVTVFTTNKASVKHVSLNNYF